MSRNLLPSVVEYLGQTDNLQIAYLVRLELSESISTDRQFIYLTSYHSDILYNSQTYEAGKVLKVGSLRQTQGITNYKVSVDVAGEYQEELDRGLIDNQTRSYIGKEIEILAALLDENGDIIPADATSNGPIQLFTGDISNITVNEGIISGNSTVVWECAGKFQDFELINGRVTDDASHRGLVSQNDGTQVPSTGAKKEAYKLDTGFQHANQTVDVITSYTVEETRYKLKSSWGGLKSKLKEYTVEVEKELELGIDLAASYLPKIYGVRKTPGIPIFIDALKNDPSSVYIVYALSEGEIDSVMNLYLDNSPIICSSEADADASVCLGNQAKGDTLSKYITDTSAPAVRYLDLSWVYSGYLGDLSALDKDNYGIPLDIPELPNRTDTEGTRHGDSFTIVDDSGRRWLRVFHGTSDQEACSELVQEAAAGNFLLQSAWAERTGRPASEYWDANSRLLDTAYVVMKIVISEDSTTIPELDGVISGKLINKYDTIGNPIPKQYTLNPVWQLLDYMIDPISGGGLDPALVDYQSFVDVANEMDKITTSYDDDYITYWRYLGWKVPPGDITVDVDGEQHDPQKAFMQCNTLLRTEDTVTKNIELLLGQFDGTINILGSKYHISVENDDFPVATIDVGELKGSIKTVDLSNKNKWNSMQAAIQNPAQGWGSTTISFFNSEYLAADNGIAKKGNETFSNITNYYTAREWAQRQLAKSRYSREVTITSYWKFLNLYPNATVLLTYDRFNYINKKLRVKTTTINSDGSMTAVMEDYDEALFDTVKSEDNSGENTPTRPTVLPPTGLEYIPIPSIRFPGLVSSSYPGANGLLIWDLPVESNVLRYAVRDWLELGDDIGVPLNQTIFDEGSQEDKVFIPITDLDVFTDYSFRVRAISYTGATSKYTIIDYDSPATTPEIQFREVTNFVALNAYDGQYFLGSELSMVWDPHQSTNVNDYQLEVYANNGNILLRQEDLPKGFNDYTYTLAYNMADYQALNAGNTGAYRAISARIRVTNGLVGDSEVVSEWTELK